MVIASILVIGGIIVLVAVFWTPKKEERFDPDDEFIIDSYSGHKITLEQAESGDYGDNPIELTEAELDEVRGEAFKADLRFVAAAESRGYVFEDFDEETGASFESDPSFAGLFNDFPLIGDQGILSFDNVGRHNNGRYIIGGTAYFQSDLQNEPTTDDFVMLLQNVAFDAGELIFQPKSAGNRIFSKIARAPEGDASAYVTDLRKSQLTQTVIDRLSEFSFPKTSICYLKGNALLLVDVQRSDAPMVETMERNMDLLVAQLDGIANLPY